MFWKFLLYLFVSDFVVSFLFSLFIIIIIALSWPLLWLGQIMGRFSRIAKGLVTIPAIILVGGSQAYFWGAWAAWCAILTVSFAASPEVYHRWLYYLTGFSFCTGPIGWFMHKETQTAKTASEANRITKGASLYGLVAVVAYIVFSVRPGLAVSLYGPWPTLFHVQQTASETLENKYFATLDGWVSRGGPQEEIQEKVIETCGKLVTLDATATQKITFMTTDREEFHFRVDVCFKVTANRVYPQPQFQDTKLVKMICESPIILFRKLCKWGLM